MEIGYMRLFLSKGSAPLYWEKLKRALFQYTEFFNRGPRRCTSVHKENAVEG